MNLIAEDIVDYIKLHISEEPPVLRELARETHANVLMPGMISGHEQGRVLSMISKLCRPKNILEIGTFTGYSTICLAEGLAKNGHIYTIEINEELEEFAKKYFVKAGANHVVTQLIGDAMELVPKLEIVFDLIFLDADKKNYKNYLNLLIDKLAPGGTLIADNTLWYGKVLDNTANKDKDTKGIMAFNEAVLQDKRLENIILPVRDGISVIRKLE